MKVVIFLLITLFTFNARGQVPNDSQSLKTVKTKLEGKWKHDKKFRGKRMENIISLHLTFSEVNVILEKYFF